MTTASATGVVAATVVVVVLLATGPLVNLGAIPASPTSASLGNGNATVETADFDASDLRIERGRFGSGVAYLRIPELSVGLDAVHGNPRLVYTVRVPTLGFERVATKLLTSTGEMHTTVGMSDRAFDPEALTRDSYRANVVVRVQSFAVDRVVFSRNATVEVTLDG